MVNIDFDKVGGSWFDCMICQQHCAARQGYLYSRKYIVKEAGHITDANSNTGYDATGSPAVFTVNSGRTGGR